MKFLKILLNTTILLASPESRTNKLLPHFHEPLSDKGYAL